MTEEKITLEDVEKDGEVLLLADGRQLAVNPEDSTVASIWMPSASLSMCRGKGTAFNLSVTNEDTGETIAGRMT